MEECFLYNNCNHINCDKSFCVRKYKLSKLYANALLSNKQRNRIALEVDSDGTDLNEFRQLAAIDKDIVNFVKNGSNLYLHSTICGNGKTSWATRFIQSYLTKTWPAADESTSPALFIDVGTFLSEWKLNITHKSSYISFVVDRLESADLVVWDDIAAKNASDYDVDKLLTIINARINAGKSNIFTTNSSPAEIANKLGERLASRICNSSIDIRLHGADKRDLALKRAQAANKEE